METEPKHFVAQRLTDRGAIFGFPGESKWYDYWKDVKKEHPKAGTIGWGFTSWDED
jgi:hypothetical protein